MLGKSDHDIVIEIKAEVNSDKLDKSYKKERLNYRKADVQKFKKYFEKLNSEEL